MMLSRKIRDLSAAALCTTGIVKLYRDRMSRVAPLVRVIEFHDVKDVGRFTNILSFVKTHYNVVAPEGCFSNSLDSSRLNILVTFDDGYRSWISVALPLLSALGIRALFFVNSGLLDAHDSRMATDRYVRERLLLKSTREMLSWADARVLYRAGHTIGGHTTNHSRLSGLSRRELWLEIAQDKERIEAMLNAEIRAFAYPFGEHSDGAEQIAREAGYTHAFCNEPCFAALNDPFRIPRLPVDEAPSIGWLRCGVEGGFDVYEKIKKSVRPHRDDAGVAARPSGV